ncbi:FtsX-like permease family protein [Umezawaea sp. NPDC059074]|uniref:FtsX-like permease family protein n=1 Tax=Umezawaea sp. NPDC059074 TaxID=3346716 RepID=UPI0036D1FB68
MKGWVNDLALGVRIALGSGRSSWRRLALTGVGVGLGMAVLLVGASMPTAFAERQARQDLSRVVQEEKRPPGAEALYRVYATEHYRGDEIMGSYVFPEGPRAPIPPGLQRIPGDGEIVLSPALADLLASPEGDLLRPRFPQEVVGTIGQEGLIGPNHLLFIAGDSTIPHTVLTAYYGFGTSAATVKNRTEPWYWVLGLVGAVVLLLPVLVFVTIGTRLAGPERERRLAALRLLGAGTWQVRRIATGDALAGAVAGLALGAGFFLVLRAFVERLELFGVSMFASDLTPDPVLGGLVVVVVPVLSVLTALVTMRGSVVDPLGVVRRSAPVRRRLWWRVVPTLVGVGLLARQAEAFVQRPSTLHSGSALAALALLLLGIPLLLPWLVERSIGRLRGGAPSWQIAVRGLQLDSGSAARLVGGVAVVLAGGITLQTLMIGQEATVLDRANSAEDRSHLVVYLEGNASERGDELAERLRAAIGVTSAAAEKWFTVRKSEQDTFQVAVASCDSLRVRLRIDGCQDGDAFRVVGSAPIEVLPVPGDRVELLGTSTPVRVVGEWTVPDMPAVEWKDTGQEVSGILLTPAAARGVGAVVRSSVLMVTLDPSSPDVVDRARAALGPIGRQEFARQSGPPDVEGPAAEYRTLRRLLLAGSLVVVALAGAGLLVLALEQVRTRRRPLAVLAAGGVPRSTLAWSLLWQNAVPLVLAVVVAVVVGSGTGLLVQRASHTPLTLDLAGIGVLTAAIVAVVLLVTACTLPAVRRATGATGLRAE